MNTSILFLLISLFFLLVFSPAIADIIIHFKIHRSKKSGVLNYRVSFLEHYVKLSKSASTLLFSFCFMALLVIVVIMGIIKKFISTGSGFIITVVIVLLIVLMVFLLRSVFRAIKLHIQYTRNESGRRVTFNTITKILSIENLKINIKQSFKNTQIKEMIIHQYSGNSRNPLADYEYLHLIMDNQEELIITSLLANTLTLSLAITSKDQKITTIYNSFNTLPEFEQI